MIFYQRNQILAVVLGAVALAHVSTAAAVADPSAANTLRRRNIAAIAGIDNKNNENNDIRAAHHHEHEHERSLLASEHHAAAVRHQAHAWWNKIQTRNNNRAEGANSPTSFSNDGDCFLGLTVMGLPCDDLGADNYAQPTTPSPTSAKPSAAPVTDAPTKSPTASPATDSPTDKPSAAPVTSSPTTSPTVSPTEVHSGSPSVAPTTSAPTASPTEVHSGSPSAAPTTSAPTASLTPAPTTLAPTTSSPTSSAPTPSPVAQNSTAATGGTTTDSVTTDTNGETDGAGINGDTITGSTEEETSGNETGDATDGPEGTGGASDNTDVETTTDDGKDVDLSDDGSGIADPLDDPEYLPVPLTPFGVEITSEEPVDREVLSQVTGDFLHAYFENELPLMGYPHYNNVALSAEQVNRRQLSLRSRMLPTVEKEIMMSGNVNFEEKPLPDTKLLDNLRSAAFAGEESKATYLDALRNSGDPGLQSATDIVVYEGDSEFNPTSSERSQPGPSTSNGDDGNGFRSYVIAAMAALSFVVFGTALFLYNRKQMRRNDKDCLSEFSGEAPDSVLLKGNLGSSDSVDSQDELVNTVPAIEPEPISLIRDAKTLERAMIRSSYNRSVIEKANERVERKSIVVPTDEDDDSKTISFAEVIAKSHSQSPRTKGQWQDISQNELLSPPIGPDPPTGQNEISGAKSTESDDPCLENLECGKVCATESPSCKLLEDGYSCSDTSDFSRVLVACSPTAQFCGDDDNYSFHAGPVTDNSMAMPSLFTPTVELPPPPISMTMDKVSPNHQLVTKALAEGNPSTPFSLVSHTLHRGSSHEQSEAPVPAPDCDASHEIEIVPSPDGSHLNVVLEDYRPSNEPLGIAAHPYATVKSDEPLSP